MPRYIFSAVVVSAVTVQRWVKAESLDEAKAALKNGEYREELTDADYSDDELKSGLQWVEVEEGEEEEYAIIDEEWFV